MSSERLRFSTAILRLLGEELNPAPDQGILELIKNSYDADASKCVVEFKAAHILGGALRVWDDGIGMTSSEIRDAWLVVGDSPKNRRNITPLGRLMVGNKGLGRLAALRLGRKVTLITRPIHEPGAEYKVEVDWRRFDAADVVEDVDLEIVKSNRAMGAGQGTEIVIADLPFAWKPSDVRRLARAILLLTDPFHPSTEFQAVLRAPEFEEIAARAREGYFTACDFHLIAKLDEEGRATAEVRDAAGRTLHKVTHEKVASDKERTRYHAPAAEFELWEFLLNKGRGFSTKAATVGDVRNWLKEFGGVRLYHRGMRVLPYGEPQNDWLDMNLRRVRSPELRPSTNNSLGYVLISDPKGTLHQKTDRLGFVESDAFSDLQQFLGDVLDWMAGERLRDRERRRKAERERVHQQKVKANESMKEVLSGLPKKLKLAVEDALKNVQAAHEAEVNLLTDTAQLYYTLGTVGTTAAAFAHQTKHPLGAIVADANALENWLGDPNELALFREPSAKAAKRIKLEADAIYAFSNVTLKLLEHEKRRARRHAIHDLIDGAVKLLEPYVEARQATVKRDFSGDNPHIWCSRAAFEAIITNFVTNSLQAFAVADRHGVIGSAEQRQILIQTRVNNEKVVLTVLDNGPGIREESISVDDVWLPGKTTTEKGTGLGLTIVRDVVADLGGTVEAIAKGELGGAKFIVTLPLKK